MAKSKKKNANRKKAKQPRKPVVLANNVSPRPVNKPATRAKSRSNMVRPQHVRAVCSVTDPFCPASKNSKWPDGTGGATMTWQFRGNKTLTTDANGITGLAFYPIAPFGILGLSATGAGTITFAASLTAYQTSSLLATYGKSYRIVSFGVLTRAVASATGSAGLATFGSGSPPALSTVLTLGSELYNETSVKAIQPGMEFAWISAPTGPTAREFVQLSATNTTPPFPWTALTIEVSGATASTAVLNCEWFMNVEFQLDSVANVLAPLARPAPAKSDHAMTAQSKVATSLGSFVEGGVKAVESAVANAASEALNSLMSDPLESLAALFG